MNNRAKSSTPDFEKSEPKSRLGWCPTVYSAPSGDFDTMDSGQVPQGSRIEIVVKGRTAVRSFDRQQIESCHLRVSGPVLSAIISMVDELAA